MKTIKLFTLTALCSIFFVLTSATELSKEEKRIESSIKVLHEFKKIRESIPRQLMDQAEGVVIIPQLINAGFAIGGKRGKGVAIVKLPNGKWSDPVFITLTGGSFGFQIGVQAVEMVLVFRHKGVLTSVEKGDFTVGGDISVAAGPVGRSSTASTDYKLEAEVYSYSRSKGLFAGLSIQGSNLAIDKTSDANFYGDDADSHEIFQSSANKSTQVVALKKAIASF